MPNSDEARARAADRGRLGRIPGLRRTACSSLATFVVAFAVGTLAACGGTPRSPDARMVLTGASPEGFALDLVTHVPPPSLAPLMVGRTDPLTVTAAVYRSTVAPPRAITVTLAGYDEAVGAAAMYNHWFAENAFMASAERNALDVGDQAECFDVEWPAFHAVIARRDTLFALVEADATVPLTQCRTLVRTLVGAWPP